MRRHGILIYLKKSLMLRFVVSDCCLLFNSVKKKKEVINVSLGAIIMDGPMIAFIYQNTSDDDFTFFEENNTHIILWRPLLQRNMLCSLSLLAHSIQGFWLPHQQYGIVDDVDEPYRFINVVF